MDLMERADYCTMNVGTPYIGHVFAHWSKQGVWRSWFNALFAACMRCARSACTLRRRILVAISFRVSTYVVYPENESNDIDSPNLLLLASQFETRTYFTELLFFEATGEVTPMRARTRHPPSICNQPCSLRFFAPHTHLPTSTSDETSQHPHRNRPPCYFPGRHSMTSDIQTRALRK